jgi:hypothetical protein
LRPQPSQSVRLAEVLVRRVVPLLAIFLLFATSAQAQFGGGGMGGGGMGGGHARGGGGRSAPSDTSSPAPPPIPPPKPAKPENQIEIVGVVQAVDPGASRVTIAYDANDELNWPRGVMPFSVYKSDLLKTVTVGEKVRFTLDGQQIAELRPF